jgi:N-formylmaleamate deformylase
MRPSDCAAPRPYTTSFADVNDQRLCLRRWSSSGPELLLLHHMLGDVSAWNSVSPRLARRYAVAAADLRGHGGSSKPEHGYRWREDLGADIACLLDTMAGPVALCGHSLGAMVAAAAAAARPDKVRALVLEDPPAFDREGAFAFFAERLRMRRMPYEERVAFFRAKGDPERGARAAADWFERFHPGVLAEMLEANAACDANSAFPLVRCPVLLLLANPDKGGVVALHRRAELAGLFAHASVSIWPDAGHGMHDGEPERFAEEVLAFLDPVHSAAASVNVA